MKKMNRLWMKKRVACALAILAVLALEVTTPVQAATILNPNNPGDFNQDGTQTFTSGATLTLSDTSTSDFILFFASDSDANAGSEIDVIATFQIRQTTRNNADAGNRVVINDGQTKSAIAASIVKDGEFGIGLMSQGAASDPNTYPVFVAVDWLAAPVTIRLRRYANGDAELVEVNGVAPVPRALLTADLAPGPTRGGFASVEFGAASVEAKCTVEYAAFRSEAVVPEPASLGLMLLGILGLPLIRRRRPQ